MKLLCLFGLHDWRRVWFDMPCKWTQLRMHFSTPHDECVRCGKLVRSE
jgi:hypothetical protein